MHMFNTSLTWWSGGNCTQQKDQQSNLAEAPHCWKPVQGQRKVQYSIKNCCVAYHQKKEPCAAQIMLASIPAHKGAWKQG